MTRNRVLSRARSSSIGVLPTSYDEGAHTIDICYSAGSICDCFDYLEKVIVSDDAIDTTRLDAGVVNLLTDHNHTSKPLGRVIKHWIEDGKAMARVQLSHSQDPEVAGAVQDIIDGARAGISVGYDYYKRDVVITDGDDGRPLQTINYWTPTEISVVNVPADALASVRYKTTPPQQKGNAMGQRAAAGAKARKNSRTRATEQEAVDAVDAAATDVTTAVEQLENVEDTLSDVTDGEDAAASHADLVAAVETLTQTVATLTAAADATENVGDDAADAGAAEGENAAASAERSKKDERNRITGILQMATRAKMPPKFAADHIKAGTKLSEVRMQILEQRGENAPGPISGTRAAIIRDESETKRQHAVRRIMDKLKGANSGDEAGVFKRARMVDIARATIAGARGLNDMHDRDIVAHAVRSAAYPGMHSSADFGFTSVIGDAMRLSIKEYRKNRVKNWEPLTSRITIPDFREIQTISAGSGMTLRQIPEGGEVEFATLNTEMGSMKLMEHAVGFAITFQALVNDSLGLINQNVKDAASMEYKLEKKLFWQALLGNPVLGDGKPAFSVEFGNLISAQLSVASYADAVRLLSLQEDMDGDEMDLEPFALVVNPVDFATAKSIFAPIAATKVEDFNIFAGVEPLIVASNKVPEGAWMLAASPDDADSVATAYLEGYEGVELTEVLRPEVNGISFIARAYASAKLTGRRGYVMSTGTGV